MLNKWFKPQNCDTVSVSFYRGGNEGWDMKSFTEGHSG